MRPVLVAVVAAVLVAGCTAEREANANPTTTITPPPAVTVAASSAATPAPTASGASLLRQVVCWYDDPTAVSSCLPPGPDVLEAIDAMGASGDERLIAPLVDMRWLDLGWRQAVDDALESLTGQRFSQPRDWYAWLAGARPPLPDGYIEWKARLVSFADPAFFQVLGEAAGTGVRPELLMWAGGAVGEVPALVQPPALPAATQEYLAPDDTVYGLQVGLQARAYPRRIVAWHGLVADTLDGTPVLVTYCGPCGGASAFVPSMAGRALTFRDAQLAYDGRRLAVDDQTGSVWDPFSGRALWGPLATEGATLPRLPLVATTWADWSEDHPRSGVLSPDTGFLRDYSEGAATGLEGTPLAPRFVLTSPLDERLAADVPVVGVTVGGESRAYPADEVRARGVVHDVLGGRQAVLLSYGPGTAIRVYEGRTLRVTAMLPGLEALGSDGLEGERWFIEEGGLVSTLDGRSYPALPHVQGSWLGWSRMQPGTSIWSP